jgi:hypothetical protein
MHLGQDPAWHRAQGLGGVNVPNHEPKATPKQPIRFENGLPVYTAADHFLRCQRCGFGYRHCPYEPRHIKGNTRVSP